MSPDPTFATPPPGATPQPEVHWLVRNAPIVWLFCVVGVSVVLARGLMLAGKFGVSSFSSFGQGIRRVASASNLGSGTQAQAEQLLGQLAAGNAAAADQVLTESATWTGKTRRTPKADQFLNVALESRDLHTRQAAVGAELAMGGVPQNEAGLTMLERQAASRNQRSWALWMLGAIGNRGVDPAHTAKVIDSYLDDPDVNVRASAVNALGILGTDETVPLLLDRFRNDPSPVVQERAACSLAEAGMYTHGQRMGAAASFVNWLDDPALSGPQRNWTLQALRDISGQNVGTDSSAWRRWYESNH